MELMNSKKLNELSRWEHIDEVNSRLDSGENPVKVHASITSQGFKISHPLVYEYAKRRKLSIMNEVIAEQYITPIHIEDSGNVKRIPIIEQKSRSMAVKRLRNELDVLEAIIQIGYNTLLNLPVGAITPKLLMEAIELRNKITEGIYGHHTEFGLCNLKKLNDQKMKQVVEIFKTFVPEDRKDEAIAAIEAFEDEFYKDTEYYEEYLKVNNEQV